MGLSHTLTIEYAALLTFTGYNLIRMRNLLAPDFR